MNDKMTINTDDARIWTEDVKAEIDAVKVLIAQVENCLDHEPMDDIWYQYDRVVDNLKAQWVEVVNAFDAATRTLKSVVEQAIQFGQESIQSIKDSKAKLGL